MPKKKKIAKARKGARVARAGSNVARPFTPEALLKRSIRTHFTKLGFTKGDDGTLILPGTGKEIVRHLHSGQRAERLQHSLDFVERVSAQALPHFANGSEIDPAKIRLKLVRDPDLVGTRLRWFRPAASLSRLGRGA
jgi:hypothetical protein